MEMVQLQTNIKMERKHSILQMEKWRKTLKIPVSGGRYLYFSLAGTNKK
jgi:hypothetical protein